MNPLPFALLSLIIFALLSCQQYRVTLNDQEIYSPPKLFNDFKIADEALRNCIQQTIEDNQITHKDKLVQLNCRSAGIANLAGIELFQGLVTLDLGQNPLADLSPILALNNLVELRLDASSTGLCTSVTALRKRKITVLPSELCPEF